MSAYRIIIVFYVVFILGIITFQKQNTSNQDRPKQNPAMITDKSNDWVQNQVDSLNLVGYFDFIYHTHPKRDSLIINCIDNCTRALKLAIESNYVNGTGMAMQSLGYAYSYTERKDSAIILLQAAENIFHKLNDKKKLATTYANLAFVGFIIADEG